MEVSISKLKFNYKYLFVGGGALILAIVILFLPNKVSAATIVPNGGCSLDDAVTSFNSASDQSGCLASGVYGNNDTLDIPSGTFSYLNSNIITVPVHINGAGVGQTTIDLQNNNHGFLFLNATSINQSIIVEDMTIINGAGGTNFPWVGSSGYSSTFQRLEFYSTTLPTPGNEADAVIRTRSGSNIDDLSSVVSDVYIHDTNVENSAIEVDAQDGRDFTNNMIANNTIARVRLTNGIGGAIVTVGAAGVSGNTEAMIENNTFEDCEFAGEGAIVAAAAMIFSPGQDISVTTTIVNNTVIMGLNLNANGSFAVVAGAPSGSSSSGQQFLRNNLVIGRADSGVFQGPIGERQLGLGGNESISTTSLGGNIFSDYFGQTLLNHPTDQEIANIGSFLGPLQNNGGITSTRALMPNSPAIDAGVDVAGMSTDQRGVLRPQGVAFDVGAYEYEVVSIPDSGTSGSGNSNGQNNGSKQNGSANNTNTEQNSSGKLANTGAEKSMFHIIIFGAVLIVSVIMLNFSSSFGLRKYIN